MFFFKRNRLKNIWSVFVPFLIVLVWPGLAFSGFETSILYGQTPDFWEKLKILDNPSGNLSELNRLLEDSYNQPEEGLALARFTFSSPTKDWLQHYYSRVVFGLEAALLTGGSIQNRILPEIQEYFVGTGTVRFGLRETPRFEESGWVSELGTSIGLGKAERTSGSVADFYPKTILEQGTLFVSGLHFSLGRHQHYAEDIRSESLLSLNLNYFHTNYSKSSRFIPSDDFLSTRWKMKTEWTASTGTPHLSGFEGGIHGISGPQPLPVSVLPASWDYVHQLDPFPSFGSIFGLGAILRAYGDQRTILVELLGGFYGGYFGGGLHATLGKFYLAGGTWGLEQTSGYRVRGSRIQYVSLGYQYDL